MIEVLKQTMEALERSVATCFDQYAHQQVMSQPDHFINQAITSLRQAIAELESQEPDKYEMDIECTKCGAKQSGVLTVNTHPPQRKPLTDEQVEKIIKANMSFQMNLAGIRQDFEAAHGIKE